MEQSNMASFEKTAQSMTAEGPGRVLPGVAMAAADSKGNTFYSNSFGFNDAGPVTVDTPMWIASCTKLMTSTAALQCIEKGLFSLDEPVDRILPELSDLELLCGFDGATGEPLIGKAKKKITFRHLVTHTSGLAYDVFNPDIIRWREYHGIAPITGISKITEHVWPLLFEPGEGWVYGPGLDWAGKAVERVNGGISLEEYMKTHIWDPLGMRHTTFRPSQDRYILENKAEPTKRAPNGGLTTVADSLWPPLEAVDDYGGSGAYSTVSEYIKILISILKNDEKLLRPKTVSKMFEPQMTDVAPLSKTLQSPIWEPGITNGLTGKTTWNHGLGGLLATEETPNRRSKGTMNWSGLPNLAWWIDRERGTCGLCATQLLDYGDAQFLSLFSQFEAMIFQQSGTRGDRE